MRLRLAVLAGIAATAGVAGVAVAGGQLAGAEGAEGAEVSESSVTSTQTCINGVCTGGVSVEGTGPAPVVDEVSSIEEVDGGIIAVNGVTVSQASGGIPPMSPPAEQTSVEQSSSTQVSSTRTSSSGGDHDTVSQSSINRYSSASGSTTTISANAVASTPPGASLRVSLPGEVARDLLVDGGLRLTVSADRATSVEVLGTLTTGAAKARRTVTLLRATPVVRPGGKREIRLKVAARTLAKLDRGERAALRITGRAVGDGAVVTLALRS